VLGAMHSDAPDPEVSGNTRVAAWLVPLVGPARRRVRRVRWGRACLPRSGESARLYESTSFASRVYGYGVRPFIVTVTVYSPYARESRCLRRRPERLQKKSTRGG